MTYSSHFINRLAQFGVVGYDLMIHDDMGMLPDNRASTVIKTDTDDYLATIAQSVIQSMIDDAVAQSIANGDDPVISPAAATDMTLTVDR